MTVESIISEYMDKQLTELDLSSANLSSLPESIGNLTNLTKLILERNRLSSLPESFRKQTNPMMYYFEGNSFPESEIIRIKGLFPNCEV